MCTLLANLLSNLLDILLHRYVDKLRNLSFMVNPFLFKYISICVNESNFTPYYWSLE